MGTCICVPGFSFPLLFAPLVYLTTVNLFACRNLHSAALRHLADICTHLTSLNIDEVNYLNDACVNHLLDVRGSDLRKLWIDGESLSDASFSNFHKMGQLELLSISFSDNLGHAGLKSISLLKRLEWLRLRRGADLEPQHFVTALPLLLPKLKLLDLEQCPDVELADLQDLVRKDLNLVVKDYYGERVSPCRTLREYLIDHPEVEFVTYDHEEE